ncbi:MAG TPA: hypothetical protein VHX60_02285 [Acidobacteriaceae bacterium]|nr:hypothetical protein [Acidobacteriaceae bacterium]
MAVSPVVSGIAYPTEVGTETRSNYFGGGISLNGGYLSNLYAGSGTAPVNDSTFLIQPTISLDQTTSRIHESLNYAPAFTLYQPTSSLNQLNQSASVDFQYRLSPHVTLRAGDNFVDSSTVFNQPLTGSEGAISGSTPSTTPGVVVPFAQRLMNGVDTEVTWQLSRNGLVGGSGSQSELHFPNPTQAAGLYNSASWGGSAFYNLRLNRSQYVGGTFEYSRSTAQPFGLQSEVQTQSGMFFYTVYLTPTLTFSLSGGPQHYRISEPPLPTISAVTPAALASVAWQTLHTNLAASYSRTVTAGAGLIGAFQSESISLDGRWQMSRTWTGDLSGDYASNRTEAASLSGGSPGGHTLSGTASLQHPIGTQFGLAFSYSRVHESYPGIGVIVSNPDSNRELASVYYRFSRPWGR